MLDPTPINFRRMCLDDLPLMHRWLSNPAVSRWYHEEPSDYESVVQKYTPCIEGQEPTDCSLILYDTAPIGYIQTYAISTYPDYARYVQAHEDAVGLDLFIGEDAYRHRGLGGPLLVKFLREVVFGASAATECVIGPEPQNTAAIRAYARAGFRYWKTIQIPGEPAPEYLMRITREEILHY